MRNFIALVAAALFLFTCSVSSLSAHDVYKEPLEVRYGLKTVSCKTCHPNSKDRSIHNAFGQYFADEFKGQEISKKYEAAQEAGEEQQKAYEEQMVISFNEVLKVVEKKKMTFEDLIKAGLLNGTRLEEKKD
ncbi:MAG: hypothetical protein MK108_15720 [Mariniblastus sp.]|nr:hypothetical protein [Mariniblastus sp.]